MHWVQKAALIYLFTIAVAVWGYAVNRYRWWPHSTLKEISEFIDGDPEEVHKSFIEKLENDFGGVPHRKLVNYQPRQAHPKRAYKPTALPNKKPRRADPLVYLSPKATPALRLVYGSFDHKDSINGAILLSPEGEVIWEWNLHEKNVTWQQAATEERKFPHGLLAHDDGSLTFSFDNGVSLQRFDRCSKPVWMTKTRVDHSLNYQPGLRKIVGVISPDKLGIYDNKTGKLNKVIQMKRWLEANPSVDPLGLRQVDYSTKARWANRGGGYWHPNDAEPLPAAYAAAFPQFEAGDLLISFRSINMIFVASPKGEIKWWRVGAWRRQHDPDWQPDGTITVFNNNMHRDISSIVKIDPKTYKHETLFDGEDEGFYTWMRGKHQVLHNGHVAITSPQQGRAFEVNAEGEVVFEFVNTYDQDRVLIISELLTLPVDYFGDSLKPCP